MNPGENATQERVRVLRFDSYGNGTEVLVTPGSHAHKAAESGIDATWKLPKAIRVKNETTGLVTSVPEDHPAAIAAKRRPPQNVLDGERWVIAVAGAVSEVPVEPKPDVVAIVNQNKVVRVLVDSHYAEDARRGLNGVRFATEREIARAKECGNSYRVDIDEREI